MELEALDRWHMKRGDYAEWMVSEERTHCSGGQVVRIINSENIPELCLKSHIPEDVVRAAYKEALETGDVLFMTYYEDDDGTTHTAG